MAYPQKPTGNNIIPEDTVFASNNTSKIDMTAQEILDGYNNDGEFETALTSRPDANRFNNFLYQVHNSLIWVINYIEELYSDKISSTGGTMSGILNMGTKRISNLATPTNDTDATTKQYVDNAVNGNSMWISEVKTLAYPSIPSLPAGVEVVPCDGRAISRETYHELFALIGTAFGSGDNLTTFNIPDYRGLFLRGWSGGSGRDSNRTYGQIQNSGAPNITGGKTLNTPYYATPYGAFAVTDGIFNVHGGGEWNQCLNFDASRSSNVYQNGLTEVRPVNSTAYYVIRIK